MLPQLNIGKFTARIPIIQGGMGVGISLSSLAGAVANAGGVGVIASAGIGLIEADSSAGYKERTLEMLRKEIERARHIAPMGPIGVNIMVALNEYEQVVRAAVKAGADIIFSGAGMPMRLPEYVQGFKTAIVPIVSSGRAAGLICRYWKQHFQRIPDAVVVEGPLAGGHLGFGLEELHDPSGPRLFDLVRDVLEAVAPYEEESGKKIPVIGGGGIYTGADIVDLLNMGASGVQMATRFVCTDECDASPAFKQVYLDAHKEDITFIKSPVGMPGRAVNNEFLRSIAEGREVPLYCPYHCIKTCVPDKSPYCIALALNNARVGNMSEGFAFAGENAYRCERIVSVQELMDELVGEAEARMELTSTSNPA